MTISAIRGGQSQAYDVASQVSDDPQVELEMLLLNRQNQQEKDEDAAWKSGEVQMVKAQGEEIASMTKAADKKRDGAILSGAFEIASGVCEVAAAGKDPTDVPNPWLKAGGDHIGKIGGALSQATFGHEADCAQIDAKSAENRADSARTEMQHHYDEAQRARGKEGSLIDTMHDAINRSHVARMALLRG